MSISSSKGLIYIFFLTLFFSTTVLKAQPTTTNPNISIKELATSNTNSIRIVYDPSTQNLYTLENNGNIKRVEFNSDSSSTSFTTVYTTADHGITSTLGLAFGSDGTLFLVGNETNQSNSQLGTGVIAKGVPATYGSEDRTWSIIAQTVEYPYGNTYNHRMSGIAVDPGGQYIYVNSGARTDHGEERDGLRETGLTSIILKLPVNGNNITLQNDREWLRTNGYLMAEGIRNEFDLKFNGAGDLISVENSGDRDDPEEMNWIREGHHYGFPWRVGGNTTPQQYSPYDPTSDPLLSPNAWGGGNLYATFYDDPDYPARPEGVTFTEPIMNAGPDADKFRDTVSGDPKDASDLGVTISTLTAHRSPDGIVFDKDSLLSGDFCGGGFVVSIQSSNLAVPIGDTGEDLIHVALTKDGDNYLAHVTKLVTGFNAPLGIELVGNTLYVLETGVWSGNFNHSLWEITLPTKVVPVELTSFTGSATKNSVLLKWNTATEINNQGFEVQRKLEGSNWTTIGFVEGFGTTTEKQAYSFVDKNVSIGTIKYRLKQIDFDGAFKYSNEVFINYNIPDEFNLSQNYPNPFNPSTKIKFSIPEKSFVTLTVFNALGESVADLIHSNLSPGTYDVDFNASKLSSGVYYYQLKADKFVETKKMILLR